MNSVTIVDKTIKYRSFMQNSTQRQQKRLMWLIPDGIGIGRSIYATLKLALDRRSDPNPAPIDIFPIIATPLRIDIAQHSKYNCIVEYATLLTSWKNAEEDFIKNCLCPLTYARNGTFHTLRTFPTNVPYCEERICYEGVSNTRWEKAGSTVRKACEVRALVRAKWDISNSCEDSTKASAVVLIKSLAATNYALSCCPVKGNRKDPVGSVITSACTPFCWLTKRSKKFFPTEPCVSSACIRFRWLTEYGKKDPVKIFLHSLCIIYIEKKEGLIVKASKEKKDEGGIGNVLHSLRLIEGLSVKEMAERMGVSSTYICDVEANRKRLSFDKLEQFSAALGVDTHTLVYFNEQGKACRYDHKRLLFGILQEMTKTNV